MLHHNVSRLVASVGGYFISTALDGVALHLYGGISATREIAGTKVNLRETSNYPWSGDIRIEIDPETPAAFDMKLRVPGWRKSHTIAVNGQPVSARPVNGYGTINRNWTTGDTITLNLPMQPERLYAHPGVIWMPAASR